MDMPESAVSRESVLSLPDQGVTNISTPMGEAYMDSVPMLVISPVNDPDPEEINRGRLHEITNQAAVTRPVTAMSIQIESAEEIPQAITKAFTLFNSERPRPVHVNIPLSIIPTPVDKEWLPLPLPGPIVAEDHQVFEAVGLIQSAKNPVLVIGGGTTGNQRVIQELADKIPCPVLSTVAARGVVAGSHPLHVGAQLRVPYVQNILQNADLGIFLGTEFAQTDHWNDDLKLPDNQIWINLCHTALDTRYGALTIQADCIDAARRIAAELPDPSAPVRKAVTTYCETARSQHNLSFTEREKIHWSVLETVMRHIPDNTTITSDMTQLAYTAVDYLPLSRPNQWLHPTGYGTLGYALPAGIGAALADQSAPVLVIVGDAGLQYTMQEMTLAAELELNIVVLLWNNDALQQICDDMDNAGISRIGIFQKNPDFLALAKACHWTSMQCSGLVDLGTNLKQAFTVHGPVLVKVDENSF